MLNLWRRHIQQNTSRLNEISTFSRPAIFILTVQNHYRRKLPCRIAIRAAALHTPDSRIQCYCVKESQEAEGSSDGQEQIWQKLTRNRNPESAFRGLYIQVLNIS
ncbi:hypothetical protein AcV5_001852 [Taiwanofungus camphoratus]|nr:hypothetical protein AcV5_001852 [Antrodia cinnamomea]